MSDVKTAIVSKLGKNKIAITFPDGTKASIKENVPVQDLLNVLQGSDQLDAKSVFRISKPEPINPSF
ncbi:TPA: hypothetical protein ACF7ZB_003424 [Kluyvera georgiana]